MWFTCHRPIASPLVRLNAKHINLIKVMLYRLCFQRSWGRWWTAIKTLTHAYSNCWHLITPVRTPHLDKNLGTSSSISCVLHVLWTVWGDCLPETKEKQNCRVFFVVFMFKASDCQGDQPWYPLQTSVAFVGHVGAVDPSFTFVEMVCAHMHMCAFKSSKLHALL